MQTARVIGRATATVKHPALDGRKLLLVQPLDASGRPDADPVLSLDEFGAAPGDTAIITTDGKHVRELVGRDDSPIRYATIALPNR